MADPRAEFERKKQLFRELHQILLDYIGDADDQYDSVFKGLVHTVSTSINGKPQLGGIIRDNIVKPLQDDADISPLRKVDNMDQLNADNIDDELKTLGEAVDRIVTAWVDMEKNLKEKELMGEEDESDLKKDKARILGVMNQFDSEFLNPARIQALISQTRPNQPPAAPGRP